MHRHRLGGHQPRRWVTAGADDRLAAVFATPVVTGAPDTLTPQLALLALVNGIAIGQRKSRPPVRPIIPMTPRIPMIPRIPMTPRMPILAIRGRFKACHRPSRKGQAPDQADQHKPRADERHQRMERVTGGTHGRSSPCRAARWAAHACPAAMAARRVLPQAASSPSLSTSPVTSPRGVIPPWYSLRQEASAARASPALGMRTSPVDRWPHACGSRSRPDGVASHGGSVSRALGMGIDVGPLETRASETPLGESRPRTPGCRYP
jgi:hypothetical protein